MPRLAGKSALITGAGSGIGAAISRRLAEEGAAVACIDINSTSVEQIASAIRAAGGRAIGLCCDVSRSDQVKEAIEAAAQSFSQINVLITAAANDEPAGSCIELNESDWSWTIAVNLNGVFFACKYGIPKLIQSGGGSVVIVASQLAHVVVPRRPAYVASKAALIQLARSMALDHAKDRIRVNTLSPGAVETNRLLGRYGDLEAVRRALVPAHPIGRLGQPQEIANGAVFLASDESSFMTGADLIIDGGYTCV